MKLFDRFYQAECSVLNWTFMQRDRYLVVPIARFVSRTGDGYIPGFTIMIFAALPNHDFQQLAWQLTLLFAIERTIYFIAKNGLQRPRPADSVMALPALSPPSDRFSFPSGHTSAAVLYACFMGTQFPAAEPLLWILAAGIGVSRVVLGMHYPSDIVAGATLGFLVGY